MKRARPGARPAAAQPTGTSAARAAPARPPPAEPSGAALARLAAVPAPECAALAVTDARLGACYAEYFRLSKLAAPSAVQARVWPLVEAGRDVLGLAPTGSGKTLGYLLPALSHVLRKAALAGAGPTGLTVSLDGAALSKRLPRLQQELLLKRAVASPDVLVVVPTRELALQVQSSARKMPRLGVAAVAAYGGKDREEQLSLLADVAQRVRQGRAEAAGAPEQAQGREQNEGGEARRRLRGLVLVVTPGRALDLLGTGDLTLDATTMLVLDEADKMLEMGFEPQIRELLARLERAAEAEAEAESQPPRLRTQNVLLSATFPKKLRAIAHSLQLLAERPATVVVDPVTGASEAREGVPMSGAGEARPGAHEARQCVPRSGADEARLEGPMSAEDNEEEAGEADKAARKPGAWGHEAALVGTFAAAISPSITQIVQVCAEHKKPRKLMRFLDKVAAEDKAASRRNASAVLIFCTKIKTVQFVHTFLKERQGLRTAGALHGGMQQRERERVLGDFKAGKLKMLVATDVAGRGIDVKGLPYVVNYDFPASLKVYAHRIGRTGRQDQPGTAFSFFTRNLSPMAHDLRELLLACKQAVDPYLAELVDAPPDGSSERPAPQEQGADGAPGAAPGDDGADTDEPAAAQGEAGAQEGHGGESRSAARRKKRRLHRKAGAAAAAGAVAARDE